MLVLTRRPHEGLVIGTSITVTVLEVRGDQVRLGITAPREVAIHRSELLNEVTRQNAASSRFGADVGGLFGTPPADEAGSAADGPEASDAQADGEDPPRPSATAEGADPSAR
ncbi:MAG: carbon storage regulator CsrA [Actinomycetota bacterium]|nr:carbon storage regulator CsrA [Actinomycetota bacterium]